MGSGEMINSFPFLPNIRLPRIQKVIIKKKRVADDLYVATRGNWERNAVQAQDIYSYRRLEMLGERVFKSFSNSSCVIVTPSFCSHCTQPLMGRRSWWMKSEVAKTQTRLKCERMALRRDQNCDPVSVHQGSRFSPWD